MNYDDLVYQWPPNIQSYEQKYFGIGAISFMLGGMAGIFGFAATSFAITSLAGLLFGAVVGITLFAAAIFATTPLDIFYGYTLPTYLWNRLRSRNDTHLRLPLIVSSQLDGEIQIENWQGELEGVLE